MQHNNHNKKYEFNKNLIDESVKFLINTIGIEKITIKAICEHANLPRTNFYYYYSNLDDAISERFIYIDKYFENTVKPNLTHSDPYKNLLLFADYYVSFLYDFSLDYVKQIYKTQLNTATSKVISTSRPMTIILNNLFEEFIVSYNITDYDCKFLSNSFMCIIRGVTFNWLTNSGNYDLKNYCEKNIKIYLNGIINS